MSETIVVTISADVASGPKLKESRTLAIDAYDKIQVTLEKGTNPQKVDIAPGGEHRVQFLLITSDHFDDDKTPDNKTLT